MASEQELPPISLISTPPVTISSPEDEYFPTAGFLTQTRSASPVTPVVRSRTPTTLLRTPPVVPLSSSRGRTRTRTNTNGEVSPRSPRSVSRLLRSDSPSDNHSTTLSPSVSSGGGSIYSSDTGRSPCSASSSDYLTPPQFQADFDKRPYRARHNSESMSFLRNSTRASTLPHSGPHKSSRRHRRKHKCHGRFYQHHNSDKGTMRGCQIAPTAPKGTQELCKGHVGSYKPYHSLRGTTDTHGRILPRLWSDPAPPLLSRRWSSVEIGSHQVLLTSTLPARSTVTTPTNRGLRIQLEPSSRKIARPYRSSTFTQGAINQDIVRTIREKLTLRKVPTTQLQIPTTITLRRASGASVLSGVSTIVGSQTPMNNQLTGSTTPRAYPRSQADTESETAYLITRQEIDSITELIEANLLRNFRPHNRASAHSSTSPPVAHRTQSPVVTSKGLLPKAAPPDVSTTTILAGVASTRGQGSLNHLQVRPLSRAHSGSDSRSPSRKSNEVVWEAGGSPSSPSSMEMGKRSSVSSAYQSQDASSITPRAHQSESMRRMDSAFDPQNSKASISEWSWRLPETDPTIVTSSDSEFSDNKRASRLASTSKSRPAIRSVASTPDVPKAARKIKSKSRVSAGSALASPEIEDVVFFPPLPSRSSTKDWYSPLPDIGLSPKDSPTRSLYNEGLDATGTVPVNLPAPQAQRHPHFSLAEPPEYIPPSIEFNPDYALRRKSVVKVHPQCPARTGMQATMGSSIGASSGERRKSSIKPGVKRVRTIDHINKGSRAGTWQRNRPPSVCPSVVTASPADISDSESPGTNESRGPVDRRRYDISPPLPKMDRVGIYARITGTVKSALGLDDCKDDCPPVHECDDCLKDPRREPSVDWIG